jgi:hypothetical protein
MYLGFCLDVFIQPNWSFTAFGWILFCAALGLEAGLLSNEIRKKIQSKRAPKRNLR